MKLSEAQESEIFRALGANTGAVMAAMLLPLVPTTKPRSYKDVAFSIGFKAAQDLVNYLENSNGPDQP